MNDDHNEPDYALLQQAFINDEEAGRRSSVIVLPDSLNYEAPFRNRASTEVVKARLDPHDLTVWQKYGLVEYEP